VLGETMPVSPAPAPGSMISRVVPRRDRRQAVSAQAHVARGDPWRSAAGMTPIAGRSCAPRPRPVPVRAGRGLRRSRPPETAGAIASAPSGPPRRDGAPNIIPRRRTYFADVVHRTDTSMGRAHGAPGPGRASWTKALPASSRRGVSGNRVGPGVPRRLDAPRWDVSRASSFARGR
jgi:hypothetical protein